VQFIPIDSRKQAYFHHFVEIIVMLFIALEAIQLGILAMEAILIFFFFLINKK